MATARQEQNMQVTHGTAGDIANARVALVLIAIVIAVFWRTVLRILLAVIAAAVLLLVGFGAFVLLQTTHT
jgi:hypothetical protein